MNYTMIVNSFIEKFATSHVILYVGQKSTNEDIKEWIGQHPWSCVITSRKDAEFASLFAKEGRTVLQYSNRSDIPAMPLSRERLPILRLCGIQGEADDEEDLAWLQLEPSSSANDTDDLIKLIPELLGYVNPMVVIGADSEIDWDLFGNHKIALNLYKYASNGTVSVWDMPNDAESAINPAAYKMLARVATEKGFDFFTETLAEALKKNKDALDARLSETSASVPEAESDVYYQGHRTVIISQQDLLLFKNVGTLLTERTINRVRPLGRVMSRKWFSNFLENSATMGPQWYGYLPQSLFYVKRSFEDALVALVRRSLDGRSITGSSVASRPIILSGDPGSSKSITLAALAYRVYKERINPVIFISKDSYLGANIGTSFDELDEAMQLLEKKADKETRILVIWDSSAFRAGVDQARSLHKHLADRGRRFVLVCSSYNIGGEGDDNAKRYSLVKDDQKDTVRFEECDEATAQIIETRGCYYVKAIRQINESEIAEFWKRVKDYSGINETTIKHLKQRLKEENQQEIFVYYHLVLSLLRENLEQGLRSEQNKVYPYIERELKKTLGDLIITKEKEKENNPFYKAFLTAGFELPESALSADNVDDEDLEKKLDTFNICVALFSRFRLSVPYRLAYAVLIGDDSKNLYSEEGQRLYRIVTRDIPWLFYGEDSDGDYSFRFRNPLEAEIFLRNHDASGEKQVELLCDILDIFGDDYKRSKCIDLPLVENLQALLRLVGPNSTYTPFATTQEYEHRCILYRLDQLIDKLVSLREDYGIPDTDSGFANIIVTFTREYYGSIWTKQFSSYSSSDPYWQQDPTHFNADTYELRIRKLIDAIALAQNSIDEIDYSVPGRNLSPSERQHLINQKYSLVVEMAQCNMRLEDLIDEYVSCCHDLNLQCNQELTKRKLEFKVLYTQLSQVINSIPTNGYAYNALFKAFIKMYERGNLTEEKKLQHLSEIMQVVETCETLDSEIMSRGGRGSDELTRNVNSIKDISSGYKISLEAIDAHRKGKDPEDEQQALCFKLYDEMLAANNAAAITFVCQKELRFPRGTRQLDDDQLNRCRRVYRFMNERDNYDCVCSNAYALAMLIRVCWMLYNKTTLTSTPECQLTYCNDKQWAEINSLCVLYSNLVGEQKNPLIILLYALSELQISSLSESGYIAADRLLGTLNENQFYQTRLRTPFIICDNEGNPVKYSGTVISTKDKSGFIQVDRVPKRLRGDYGIRFRQYSIGRKKSMPSVNEFLPNLELGIGFTCFSVFTEEGRKDKEERS